MKEIPILFNTSMVQSIRADIKTQTRRIVKGMALQFLYDGLTPEYVASLENGFSPYGNPSDQLWVRETFCEINGVIRYKADEVEWIVRDSIAWKPSIFMPRAACREILQVESISIEQINDIDEPDAIAEGIFFDNDSGFWYVKNSDIMAQSAIEAYCKLWQSINGHPKPVYTNKVVTSYVCFPWSEQYRYDALLWRVKPLIQHVNPFVWVVKFKRVK